jgi:hypothetical protein
MFDIDIIELQFLFEITDNRSKPERDHFRQNFADTPIIKSYTEFHRVEHATQTKEEQIVDVLRRKDPYENIVSEIQISNHRIARVAKSIRYSRDVRSAKTDQPTVHDDSLGH